jgi:hypothetical protein
MFLLMLGLGCVEPLIEEVSLSGTLTESAESTSAPVTDGTVAALTLWEEETDCTTTNASGEFSLRVPASSSFYVQTSAPGRISTTFTGWSGIEDLEIDPGVLWVRDADELDAIRSEFEGCEGAEAEGGIIEGEVRVYLPVEAELNELPLVTTATISAMDASSESISACYLDDDGLSDPTAEITGETGRFAIFGLEPGTVWLTVAYTVTDGMEEESEYPLYMPSNGTAPMYPVLVDLP